MSADFERGEETEVTGATAIFLAKLSELGKLDEFYVTITRMKPVVGIFAHPDDEVFGPGGTLAQFAREGRDVYLICVTNGEAGMNQSSKRGKHLGEIRREELEASAAILGIKKVFFLDYEDGTLCNNLYHEIAEKITNILTELRPDIILTMEHRGVSGHLDHIAVSMISSFVFEKLSFVYEIWFYALTKEARKLQSDYFIYFPPGYSDSQLSKTISIADVWEQKVAAMHQHESQKDDIEKIIGIFLKRPKEEHFFVQTKTLGE